MSEKKKIILMCESDELKDDIQSFLSDNGYEVLVLKNNISSSVKIYNPTETVIANSKIVYDIKKSVTIVIAEGIEECSSLHSSKHEIFRLLCASIFDGNNIAAYEERIDENFDSEAIKEFIRVKLTEFNNSYVPANASLALLKAYSKTAFEAAKAAFQFRKLREYEKEKSLSNLRGFNKASARVLAIKRGI